jgi:hypothetical protein
MRVGHSSMHLPPRGSSIFHDMKRSKLARDQAAAKAAQAQSAEQTTQEPVGPSRDPAPGVTAVNQQVPTVTLSPEPAPDSVTQTAGGIRSWVHALQNPFRISHDALPNEATQAGASMPPDLTTQYLSPLDQSLGDNSSISTDGGDEAPSAPEAEAEPQLINNTTVPATVLQVPQPRTPVTASVPSSQDPRVDAPAPTVADVAPAAVATTSGATIEPTT